MRIPSKIWNFPFVKTESCFFPEPASYLEAAQSGVDSSTPADEPEEIDYFPHLTDEEKAKELCPYAQHGECRYGENCVYLHGDFCDYCGRAALHPVDMELRSQHVGVSIPVPV